MPSEVDEKSSKKNSTAKKATAKKVEKNAPEKKSPTKESSKAEASKAASSSASHASSQASSSAALTAVVNPVLDTVFEGLLTRGARSSDLSEFVTLKKSDGKFSFELTKEGERLDSTYQRAYATAEEKGPNDREVMELLTEVKTKWSAHPGVVENEINEGIEAGETAKASQIADKAALEWAGSLAKAGVTSYRDIVATTPAGHLFIQLLANYSFALERNNQLAEALNVALLSKEIDPADPENILSAIINLHIRVGNPMAALRALESQQESLAPFVLYGRAIAYYALGQQENASGAVQTAIRHWPDVARSLTREWKGGTPMPKPGEAVSELQVLYGYYEVFGTTWKSVPGATEWLRDEAQNAQRAGAKPQRYIGLTRSGLRTDAQGNVVIDNTEQQQTDEARAAEQEELLRKAQLIGEDEFVRFMEVRPNEYAYALTERGEELEEAHNELYRTDMKLNARISAIEDLLKQWPGHANAAIALVRYYGQRERFTDAVELLEPVIFDLQKFWPDDLVESGKLTSEWAGNKPILTAYAYMVLNCAESGDTASAKAFADDYLMFNPSDNFGVRQKAIELYIQDGEYQTALKLINEAIDPVSAYNVFGRALIGYAAKANGAELALKNAIESRPLIYRELVADKHRMPHNYNPSFVHYFSPEEAYNYQQSWSNLWMHKHGALAWLRKEGRKYLKQ